MYEILKTDVFEQWYKKQALKVQLQVDGRLERIQEESHFGHTKVLGNSVYELKFNNGNRVYYILKNRALIILLTGGNKNSQSKDIRLAKRLAQEV